jgi:tellurite resistance protein
MTELINIVDASLREDALSLERMGSSLRDAAYTIAEADGAYTAEERDDQLGYARLMVENALSHLEGVRQVAARLGVRP